MVDFRIPLSSASQRKELLNYRRQGTKFYGLKIGQAFDLGWAEYFDEIVEVVWSQLVFHFLIGILHGDWIIYYTFVS